MINSIFVVNYNQMLCGNQIASLEHAAERWNVGLTIITESEFKVDYHAGAIKLSCFDLCDAARILILDADTIVRSNCPNPFEIFREGYFYAAKNIQPQMSEAYQVANGKIQQEEMGRIFAVWPTIDFDYDLFFNSGVVLVEREWHEEIMGQALTVFLETPGLGWWDQSALNYVVQATQAQFRFMDVAWNYQHPPKGDTMEHWVYHYAGSPERYEILKRIQWNTH